MTDTPRTDAVIANMASIPRGMGDNEIREHARDLERENTRLRFLISEVVETQSVSDACRADLVLALQT